MRFQIERGNEGVAVWVEMPDGSVYGASLDEAEEAELDLALGGLLKKILIEAAIAKFDGELDVRLPPQLEEPTHVRPPSWN